MPKIVNATVPIQTRVNGESNGFQHFPEIGTLIIRKFNMALSPIHSFFKNKRINR